MNLAKDDRTLRIKPGIYNLNNICSGLYDSLEDLLNKIPGLEKFLMNDLQKCIKI